MNAGLHWGDLSPEGRTRQEFLQTRDILDITAAGTALFQEVVDRMLHVCHKRLHGAVNLLDTRQGSGDAWHLNRATPGPDAIAVDDTDQPDCGDETSDPNYDTFTPSKVSFTFRNLWVGGSVSRFVIERGRGFMDVLAEALVDGIHRMANGLEIMTFQGNFGAGAPKEFDGLFELINAFNGTGGSPEQIIVPENATGDATPASSVSGDMQLEDLDHAIDEVRPGPLGILVTKAGARVINSRLVSQRQYTAERITIRGGFRVETYDDHPIVRTTGFNDDMAWGLDGSSNPILTAMSGAATAAATTAVVVVNLDEVFYAELLPVTVEPLERCTMLRSKFEGLHIVTLVEECPESASMIIGMLPTP